MNKWLISLTGVPAIVALAVLVPDPALAQTAKAPVAVNIEADQMEILDADKKAVFRGNVDATRGNVNLKAAEVTVTYAEVKQADGTSKTDATNLDAKGGVTIKTPRETITGDWAKFDPQSNELLVGGSVKLVQGSTGGDDRRPGEGQFPAEVRSCRSDGPYLKLNLLGGH